jgi:hypothetical protein
MKSNIERSQTPEERELKRKLAELATLEDKLAQRELDLATLQAELKVFETRYLSVVGIRYAELDEIEAKIAEAQATLNPDDKTFQEEATNAREQANESAAAAGEAQESDRRMFESSDELKRLYREVAKRIHPDLSTDKKDYALRQRLMVEANRAYKSGDEEKLRSILNEWERSPDAVKGEGAGADLVRVIRKIAQVEARLQVIQTTISGLERSELHQLKVKVEKADQKGRDVLAEMTSHLEIKITEAKRRLGKITKEGLV